MDIKLENDQIKVTVSSIGAELQSVIRDGEERIWQADPAVWGKHAPLLFPFVGRLRDGYYEHEGKRIDAPMHGFCIGRPFEVVEGRADAACAEDNDASATSPMRTCVELRTASDADTRKVYPFDFVLRIRFALDGNKLVKTHVIENTGTVAMPFEVGGHEAYSTRMEPSDTMADYCVQFAPGTESIAMFGMDEQGILTLPKTEVPLEDARLWKTPEQLGIDTIILENVPESTASLLNVKTGHADVVEFAEFPYLGIWTMAGQEDARYMCIEPWSALPDAHFSPHELSQRAGVITLQPGETKTLSYTMAFV